MRIAWRLPLLAATILGFACSPPPRRPTAPSGGITAIKQYKGDEETSWDIWLVVHCTGGDRRVAVLVDQKLAQNYGTDGVAMGWEDDRHLTIAWPRDGTPVAGPAMVDDVAVAYRPFDPDLDRVHGVTPQIVRLEGAGITFSEIDEPSGSIYAATGKPIPETKCIVAASAFDPAAAIRVTIEMIGDGIGRPSDPNPPLGMIDVRLSLAGKDGERRPEAMPTQAKWGAFAPAVGLAKELRQLDSSLLYKRFTLPAARAMFDELRVRRLTAKFAFGFDRRIVAYDIRLAADADTAGVFRAFNNCAVKTTLYEGRLRAPVD